MWVTWAGDQRCELRAQRRGGEEGAAEAGRGEVGSRERGVTQRPRTDRRTARPGTGHRAGTAPPGSPGSAARKAASARGGRRGAPRPRLGGVGAAGLGVSASGRHRRRRRRAQQSRPAAATHCPAPARYRPDGLSAARGAARPRDRAGGRAEPRPDKLPGRGPSPPGALYTLGGVLARGSGTSRAGRPGAAGGSGC